MAPNPVNPARSIWIGPLAAIALALLIVPFLSSCVRYSSVKHGSGQIAYWGESSFGKRTGIWVYFDETGAIQRDIAPGRERTGFYEADVKTRELTEAEFQAGLAEARKLARMTGAKMLREDPR